MTLLLASVAFLISGFAALVYQIVWQRLLVLPIGADVYSTTLIVSAFMAGLGCGSLAGGHLADRLTPSQNLLMFVAAETCVGLFGFFSRHVFYDWHYLRLAAGPLHSSITVGLAFVSLLWPTFWMGVSLPLLGRGVTRGLDRAANRVGVLYGLNTLGASLGALATTWVLMPRLGLEGAVQVAAAGNLLAAGAVLAIVLRQGRTPAGEGFTAEDPAVAATPGGRLSPSWSFHIWALLYAAAGFQALSLEIIWFRLLGVMLKSSAFTFGTLLTIYLGGLGIGAAAASAALPYIRRPALAFLLLQGSIGIYAGASIAVLVYAVGNTDWLPALSAYFAGYEPLDAAAAFSSLWNGDGGGDTRRFLIMYAVLPMVLVGPPTIAMGAAFPCCRKSY